MTNRGVSAMKRIKMIQNNDRIYRGE
jgi:hypothetical protein